MTEERFFEVWDKWKDELPTYTEMNLDHTMAVLSLLRDKIPYNVCKSILGAAEHDIIYLSGIAETLPYITEYELKYLIDCNVGYDKEFERFYLFV